MKIKLRLFQELVTARSADRDDPGLVSRFLSTPVPVAVAWGNRGRAEAVRVEGARLDELRKKLIEDHGGTISAQSGNQVIYQFPKDKVEAYARAEAELLDQEVDLPGSAVKVTDLPADKVRFSEADLGLLARAGLVTE